MNLNPVFMELENELGYPVEQDMYQGREDIYGVFSYTDETGSLYGDNRAIEDTAYMRIQIYTPKNYNYMDLKHRTRDWLENKGFCITGIRTWLESKINDDAQKIRCTVIDMTYTDTH